MNKGVIAGIVIGSVCGVGLITCIVLLIVRSNQHNVFGGRSEKLQLDPAKGSKLATWSWKGTSSGGFGGYGIFGNSKDIDYTYINNKAVGRESLSRTSRKWDDQVQNTMANGAAKRKESLDSACGGCQFWDFISKDGSYYQTYKRRSLDGLKREFDGEPSTPSELSSRYKQLITNLANEGIEVAILIGGKPNIDGTSYHGESLPVLLDRITSAGKWITEEFRTKNGIRPYIALDIEPADVLIDSANLSKVEDWYEKVFPQVVKRIRAFEGKDIYFGMAINKNPYSLPKAYNALRELMSTSWKYHDGKDAKERGFRVLELMYWFTYADFPNAEHLSNQIKTTSVDMASLGNPTPLSDAEKFNIYLQFGVECTGEVDLLSYVPVYNQPEKFTPPFCNKPCNATTTANCYKAQSGAATVSTNLGYLCKSPTDGSSASDMFTNPRIDRNKTDKYYNAARFKGSTDEYAAVYGFPYVGYCGPKGKGSETFYSCECNTLGSCVPDSKKQEWNNSCCQTVSSAPNYESCKYLNNETWLLGGGLQNISIEKLFHSEEALDYLRAALGGLDRVYRIPFCVEELSAYAGWLRNFKSKNVGEIDFPDKSITSTDPAGSICIPSVGRTNGKLVWSQKTANLPCLGQTVLDDDGNILWVAGTLESDGSCNLDKYYYSQ